jgi:hypothetical protein
MPEESKMLPMTRRILAGAAAIVVAMPADGRTQSFPLECARRDVQVVIQLEDHVEAQDIDGNILYDAFETVRRARAACSEGREAAGLALYESVLTTALLGRVQAR